MVGAVRQQASTLANVDPDLCRHMASLGNNKLNIISNVIHEQMINPLASVEIADH